MADEAGASDPLGGWRPAAWLIAGTIGVVYASFYGAEAVLGTYPSVREFLGPVMNVLAFVALLGLYPVLVDRHPLLARIGGIAAVLAIVGSVLDIGATAGVVPEGAPWFAASQLLFILLGMTLAFLAYAVATLRSDAYSRPVGLLLLAPVAIMVLNVAIVVAGYASPEGRLLVSGLWAVSYLAIGNRLRTEGAAGDGTRPTPGATTR